MADLVKGQLYRVSYDGRAWPNLYRYEGASKPVYCQLHGEYMWDEHLFTKRRNSDVRPWSENHWFRIEDKTFEPAEYVAALARTEDGGDRG